MCYHAIVRLSCSDMHSTDADAAASAQDTATALRLSCCTLKAAVDATVAQMDIRASSSAELAQAAALFPGLQLALGCMHTDMPHVPSFWHSHACILPPTGLQRIHLRVPASATTIRVKHEQMPCLTDIRCGTTAPAGLYADMNLSAPSPQHRTTMFRSVHAG
jgi:hypothetical protein